MLENFKGYKKNLQMWRLGESCTKDQEQRDKKIPYDLLTLGKVKTKILIIQWNKNQSTIHKIFQQYRLSTSTR